MERKTIDPFERTGKVLGIDGAAPMDARHDDDDCVVVCHKPWTPTEKTKCLPPSAVPVHLGRGDRLGRCEDRPDRPTPMGDTVLDRLGETDGAQALVAAVLVVDDVL